MRVVSRFSPVRGGFESSVLPRLVVCLALMSGCGHAVSQETNDGPGGIDPAERVKGIGKAADGDVGVVVVDCDVKGEGKCEESGPSATGVGKVADLVDEGAGDAVDGAAGLVANVGECSGRRFKKCR